MTSADKLSRRYDSRDNFHGSDGGKYGKESKYDDPPHSRLFIVCGKSITEEDFRESFSKHGTIEEIWVVKDRNTEEPKGKLINAPGVLWGKGGGVRGRDEGKEKGSV